MAFQLPPLPYPNDALEPNIDAKTMEIHHDKHHAAYVNNLNAAIEGNADLGTMSAEDLIKNLSKVPEDKRTAVRNNGGGHVNHTMFWEIMGPNGGGQPSGALAAAIDRDLGGFDAMKEAVNKAGAGRFGSRLGLGRRQGWQACRHEHPEPGQPADGRLRHADPGRRRLGARLLPEIPESPTGLPQRLVEHGQLGRRRQALHRRRRQIIRKPSKSTPGRQHRPGVLMPRAAPGESLTGR